MNKKKLVSLCLVLALLVTAAVGATFAYFTDTEQANNTMTVGNVEINIDEFQKVDGQWQEFNDGDFTLYPVDWNKGVQNRNKIVYTANVSSSEDDAYIRTIVLFEKNDVLPRDYEGQDDCCVPGLHFNYFEDATATSVVNGKTIHGAKTTKLANTVTVNGNDYWVVVFEEVSGLAVPHDEALFSLNGVFMDKNITQDQIEGWGTDGVQILVFSQGIQADGLTYDEAMTELGTVDQDLIDTLAAADNADNNDWADIL